MDAKTAVTLAAISYCDNVQATLKAALPGWTAPWVPDQAINGNLAFVAYDGGSQYAVAIRGSLLNFTWGAFENWFNQDLNVFYQVPWTIGGDNSAMIAQGASDGLNDLNSLVDSSSGSPVSMIDFLEGLSNIGTSSLAVTGHSLGGNLATVLAPWIYYTLQNAGTAMPSMSVYTFAAPAAGNKSFANDYDSLFKSSSWRYQMENDIVPMFPIFSQMVVMSGWYSPAPLAEKIFTTVDGVKVTLQEAIVTTAGLIEVSEIGYGSYYTQTNQSQGTEYVSTTVCDQWQNNTLDDFFQTAGCYHSIQNYAVAVGVTGGVTCATTAPGQVQRPEGLIR
jgi:triacylglycerol lipase